MSKDTYTVQSVEALLHLQESFEGHLPEGDIICDFDGPIVLPKGTVLKGPPRTATPAADADRQGGE